MHGLSHGKAVALNTLKTIGLPKKLKLTADRTNIIGDRNVPLHGTVEVVDENSQHLFPLDHRTHPSDVSQRQPLSADVRRCSPVFAGVRRLAHVAPVR